MEVLKTNQINHGLKLASLLIDFILILTTSDWSILTLFIPL